MKYFSLLIKPSSHGCNLRCIYCFYLKKKELYPTEHPKMSLDTLDRMISSFQNFDLPNHSYAWQGGEPTTMGLDFFKKVTELQAKYGKNGQIISNGLQTNATLINDEWAEHLAKYNFLVGVSLDGPAEIHDPNRPTIGGKGSHHMVMKAINSMKKFNVDYNILTLVNNRNIDKPLDIYKYIRDDMNVTFHQYIECVEFDKSGQLMPYAVTPQQWGEFLCEIFDEWYKKDTERVSVRLFDSILAKLVDKTATACVFAEDCRQYLVVEHNGDIYPCDFFVQPDWKLGNINSGEWNDFIESPLYEKFGKNKMIWNEKCFNCEYSKLCLGCCPKNRLSIDNDPRQLSALCEGWEIFYSHCLPRLKTLANKIKKRREEEKKLEMMHKLQQAAEFNRQNSAFANIKVGRNEPCPCGSGKKYKKCCGK